MKIFQPKIKSFLLFIAVLLSLSIQSFTQKKEKMKIKPPQKALDFTINDVHGNPIDLTQFKGKKVLLSFYRNVGCPVCNLRFHEIQQQNEQFRSKGLIVLAVYESTAANMQKYLENEDPYAIMIPDPDQKLYKLYQVEQSTGKLMKGMFNGAMKKMKAGKKLFKNKIKQDGSSNRIGADFLIDENGNIKEAYYGKHIGDHLPLEKITEFIN